MELDPWQEYCLRMSLAEVEPDLWSAFLVGIIVGRQNGKGTLIEARELAGLFLIGESLILHSAHEFKTCYEHFLRITQLIEATPELDNQVQKVRRGVGEQAVELRNGNRLRFIARSSGSGRGMSAPCVVLDEAMFLTEAQIGAILPTLSAQANPQVWYTSSAPLASSVALHRLRQSALDGTGDRLFYAEWGNTPDVDPSDPVAIARANPALGRRLFLDFVQTEREAMSPPEFARERLGVAEAQVSTSSAIPIDEFDALADAESTPEPAQVRLGFDVSPDSQFSSFGLAGKRADGFSHVEVRDRRPGTSWVIDRAKELADGHNTPVVVVSGSPGARFVPDFQAAGIKVDVMSPADAAAACGRFIDACGGLSPTIRHRSQPVFRIAVQAAQTKDVGDGMKSWSRKSTSTDISPLTAVTAAFGRLSAAKVAPEPWVIMR